MFVKVVENDLGHFATLELDHKTHTVFVGLVTNIRNTFDFLFVDELSDALLQSLLINLIRQGINHDRLPITFVHVLKVRLGAHDYAATPGAITFANANDSVNNSTCGEIRRRNELNELIYRTVWVAQAI